MKFKYFIFDPYAPRRFWRFFVYFYLLVILFFSCRPDYSASTTPNWMSGLKNFLHIPAYAGLTFLLLCGLGRLSLQTRVLALLLSVAYGGINEIVQMSVPGRSSSWDDIGRNALGALAVVVLVRENPIRLIISAIRRMISSDRAHD